MKNRLAKKLKKSKDKRKIKEIKSPKEIREIKKEGKKDFESGEEFKEEVQLSESIALSTRNSFSPTLTRGVGQRNSSELEEEVGGSILENPEDDEKKELNYKESSRQDEKYFSSSEGAERGKKFHYDSSADYSGVKTIDESNLRKTERKVEGFVENQREEMFDPLGENRRRKERNTDLQEIQSLSGKEYQDYETDKQYKV